MLEVIVRFLSRFLPRRNWEALFLLFFAVTPLLSLGAEKVEVCLEKTVAHLGIDRGMMTDPAIMRDLFKNQFYLVGSPVAGIYTDLLTKPQPIRPALEKIEKAILTNQPAVGEFLCAAVAEKLLTKVTPEGRAILTRTIHHILLLDRLVQEMINSPKYTNDLKAFYLKKRAHYGVTGNFLTSTIKVFHATGSVFEVMKQGSVDLALDENLKLREKTKIELKDIIDKDVSLRLNIDEAMTTDLVHGFKDNALAGHLLAKEPVRAIQIVGENKAIEQTFVDGWAPLYETWNLAFITGNLSDLQVLYPKLLIPSVIGARDDDYLFRRVLALWVTINLYLFDRYEQKPRLHLPNATALAQRWGEINLKYARQLGH